MLTIYSVPVAVYCAKLRIILAAKKIPFEELPPPGGYGSDEYRALVPSGNLPAMIHDGFMLADSEAISEYLNDAFSEVPMLPSDIHTRAKAREKSRLHDTRLEPAVRALYPFVDFKTRDADAVAAQGVLINKHLNSLALFLKTDPLPTDKLWLCDGGFAVTFAWIKAFEESIGLTVDWPESVQSYDARLRSFDVVKTELAAYKPAMDAYLEKARPS